MFKILRLLAIVLITVHIFACAWWKVGKAVTSRHYTAT
jgi:hypothetical protein